MGRPGPESKLVGEVVDLIESVGGLVYNLHGSAYTGRGRPDLVGVLPGGLALFVEVKRPGSADDGLGMRQRREACEWARRGALTLAGVDDLGEVRRALAAAGFVERE